MTGLWTVMATWFFLISAMTYLGVMETVNKSEDIWYYVDREVPERSARGWQKNLKMDNLERFFPYRFFELPNGEYYGLEVNNISGA